jgi:hypothetical protein
MRATGHACIWIAAAGLVAVSGCAPVAHKTFKPGPYAGEYRSTQPSILPTDITQEPARVVSQDSDGEPLFETGHPLVQSFVAAYQAELRGTFARSLERGRHFLPR